MCILVLRQSRQQARWGILHRYVDFFGESTEYDSHSTCVWMLQHDSTWDLTCTVWSESKGKVKEIGRFTECCFFVHTRLEQPYHLLYGRTCVS